MYAYRRTVYRYWPLHFIREHSHPYGAGGTSRPLLYFPSESPYPLVAGRVCVHATVRRRKDTCNNYAITFRMMFDRGHESRSTQYTHDGFGIS